MVLDGCYAKSRLLEGLREQISRHRREDLEQLTVDRQEAWARWDERLARLGDWTGAAEVLKQTSQTLLAWRDSARWFDRAQIVGRRYSARLELKTARLETQLLETISRLKRWQDRLLAKEIELREFIERQAVKTAEIVVSSARKRPHLDFVFNEREEEGRLAIGLRDIRREASRALARLSAGERWAGKKADANPAYFEIPKRQILEAWSQVQERLAGISEASVNQGLAFEEGRQRLRWVYETVQRMRALPDAPAAPRPFLHRLFNFQDE